MKAYSSLTFANEFIAKSRASGASHLKLQKLIYCAYGWWLARNDEPIITDPPVAWTTGPIFPELFTTLKEFGFEEIDQLQPDPASGLIPLIEPDDERARTVIDWIWDRYGKCDAATLASQCHRPGTPWDEVCNEGGVEGTVIPVAKLQDYYENLANIYLSVFPDRDLFTKVKNAK